jgi:dynein heavy chain
MDLSSVNKLYQYSLKWFIKIYENEIYNKENVNSSLDPAIDFSNRLTKLFYVKTSLGLFQEDKLMLAFVIAFNIMKQNAKFDINHFNFIINGPYT